MFCRKCKNEIENDSVYCRFCGVKQAEEHKKRSRANGTGSAFKAPDGRWKGQKVLYYYIDKNGKRQKKTSTRIFDRKTDALKFVGESDKEDQSGSPTLNDLHEIFIGTKKHDKLSKSQQEKLGYAWNKMQEIQFAKIADLTIDKMQKVINGAAKTYYPARDMKVLLSHLFTLAIQRQQETINKSEYIELPDAPKAKRQAFTEEEIATLWDDYNGQCPDGIAEAHEFTGYIIIMNYTGMRIGELFKIEKKNVYLKEHYMMGGEKTEAGRDREIPISDLIYPIVKHFYDKGKTKLVHRNIWGFYDEYWETLDRLKIRHLPPQTCRHTYFTMLAQNNVHPALIAAMGGHAQYETAIDNYNRLPLADKIAAVNKI
jgi:integrase